MTPVIKKQIETINEILKDNPADANAYVLLRAMVDLLQPVSGKLFESADQNNLMVAKQIKLINDIALAVIEFLDVKKANLKG